MQIDTINVYQILLPFAFDFFHSLKKNASANNIVVEVVANNGQIKGYGEGAPRAYVTGETQESAAGNICNFIKQDNFPWCLRDVSRIWNFVDNLPKEKEFSAAICALEMALLDALGKSQRRPIIEYFPKDFYADKIYYGIGLPLSDRQNILKLCRLIEDLKIFKLKLKMGKDFRQNKETVETVGFVFGDNCQLKVDVNCVWDFKLALKHIPLLLKYKVNVLEQPMMPGDPKIYTFAKTIHPFGIVLMADESACTLTDMKKISKNGHYQMINVRLSKSGGLRRSLEIVDYLRKTGLSFQIGCQLGESGLLSAAGRVLSLLCSDALYYDGSYDEFLLKENLTVENVSFGPGGAANALTGPGLGVQVSPASLEKLSNQAHTKTISRPSS